MKNETDWILNELKYHARKVRRLKPDYDLWDFINHGYLGYCEAAARFNSQNWNKKGFRKYAILKMRCNMLDVIYRLSGDYYRNQKGKDQDSRRWKKKIFVNIDEEKLKYNTDIIEQIDTKTRIFILKKVLQELAPRNKFIIIQYYFKGKIQRDIGDSLGVTHSRITQLRKEILKELRVKFENRIHEA